MLLFGGVFRGCCLLTVRISFYTALEDLAKVLNSSEQGSHALLRLLLFGFVDSTHVQDVHYGLGRVSPADLVADEREASLI